MNGTNEIIDLYLAANEEDKILIRKFINLFAENPSSLDFARNWKGSTADLKEALISMINSDESLDSH